MNFIENYCKYKKKNVIFTLPKIDFYLHSNSID